MSAPPLAAGTNPRLFDRLYGCLAGVYIGSAMGVPVEGWSMERVAKEYGVLKTFQPHKQWWNFAYPAGSTEDGVERAKYMCLAIAEKQDRISADDLVKMWLKITDDPAKLKAMEFITTDFDRELMALARANAMPAAMLGTTIRYSHLSGTIRCFAPIAMINACDPDGAVKDLNDVARVYHPLTSDGLLWGVSYNAALAYAFRPDATVDSVLETAMTYAPQKIKRELQRGLDIAKKHADPFDMRQDFNQVYNSGRGVPYPISYANETAVKALAIFGAVKATSKTASSWL
jgi:ADP-ribosylglycohydrolase